MPKQRNEERWAAACIKAALPDTEIKSHDDGSRPGMYDLGLFRGGQRAGAVEITTDADPAAIQLWKLINGGQDRWIEPALVGGWSVELLPSARATTIRQKLPGLLAELERLAIAELPSRNRPSPHLEVLASELGVVSAYQGGTDYPGSIYPTIAQPSERTGGMVPETSDPLARWIGDWLREPRRADNLRKLTRSGLPERHAFVIVAGFATAPFPVVELLMRPAAPAPTILPDLPSEVTHVWTMSAWTSGDGMRWSPDLGWTNFVKIFTVDSAP